MQEFSAVDFKKLFEAYSDPRLILTDDLTIAAANDAYLRTQSMERFTVEGQKLVDLPPRFGSGTEFDFADLATMLANVVQTKKPDAIARKIGTGYMKFVARPILGASGEIANILLSFEDAAEKTREEFAVEMNDRFFEVSLDMLCISGYDGFFKRVNPAFEAVLGYTPEEICSKSYLEFIHPDDIERTRKEVENQLAKNEKVLSFENRYRCKDGTYRLLNWKSAPVGSLMFAVARDVTETRKAEAALRVAKEEADLLNRDLSSFSFSVAHDLRSPLHSLVGFSTVILEDYGSKLEPDVRDYLRRIGTSAVKMEQMIDGLLELSGIVRKELYRQPVDLSSLAREIADDLKGSEPSRAANFTIVDGVTAEGDPTLLRVVLMNLLNNAWKYSSKIASEARIEFASCMHEGRSAYFVRDNGAGFDMSDAKKLFGPFQRLHSAEEFEGNGIGLATVQRIIHRHGGKIWADASLGHGATFFFTL